MKRERLEEILSNCRNSSLLVIGDLILDEYSIGRVNRISPEAPVPIVEIERRFFTPGGAGNTACNITALGGRSKLMGVVGDDELGKYLLVELAKRGVDTSGVLTDPARPTTCKTRIIAHTQQIVRIDRESRALIGGEILERLMEMLPSLLEGVSAVIASDYNKGLFHPHLADLLVEQSKKRGLPLVVDPKPQNMVLFKGSFLICPNEREARYAVGDATESLSLEEVGRRLLDMLEVEGVLITQGERGMTLFQRGKSIHIPALATEVHDVTGAGDTVMASLALALTGGASLREAMEFASLSAAVVVRKLGTAQPTPQEMLSLVEELSQEETWEG